MCHSRGLNNKINNIQKRALRIVCQDKKIKLTGKVCVYPHEKLAYLVTEIYKVKNGLSPKIMKKVFVFQENHHYQFLNLGLKHGSLIAALINSAKFLLKILILLEPVQISNGIHKS